MYYYLIYLLTVLIWGSTWYVIKLQIVDVHPSVSVAYRFFLSSLILFIFCLLKKKSLKLNRIVYRWLVLQGLVFFCLNYVLFYFAGKYINSGIVAVVFSCLSIMIMLNKFIFFKLKPNSQVVLGSIVGILGISLLFMSEFKLDANSDSVLLGLLLSVIATYAASWGNIITQKINEFSLPITVTNAYAMFVGAIGSTCFALYKNAEFKVSLSLEFWLALGYLSVFATVLGFGMYFTLLKKIGPEKASYSAIMFPVVALIISSIYESFIWSYLSIIGLAFVISGNILVFYKRKPKII